MYLPILPDEVRLDLSERGYPGVVAFYRPMDVDDKSRWFDECGGNIETTEAATQAVKRQLLRLEGVEAVDAEGNRVPFDAKNAQHKRAIPIGVVLVIYADLIDRTALTEPERKN